MYTLCAVGMLPLGLHGGWVVAQIMLPAVLERWNMIYFCVCVVRFMGLQCFDTVGWAAGRASGL